MARSCRPEKVEAVTLKVASPGLHQRCGVIDAVSPTPCSAQRITGVGVATIASTCGSGGHY
eukprot:2075496-Amphidinium_carterae.3